MTMNRSRIERNSSVDQQHPSQRDQKVSQKMENNFDSDLESFGDENSTQELIDNPVVVGPPEQKKLENFSAFWEARRFCDFSIVVGSKSIPVHREVLALRSLFFAALFESDRANETKKFEISRFSMEAIESFFKCLYTGEVGDLTHALDGFKLASMYAEEIRRVYEDSADQWINKINDFRVFSTAKALKSPRLLDAVLRKLQ